MATTNMFYSHECIFHRDKTGEINNNGFPGILQVTCIVYHWHHLFYYVVFYLQN